MVATTLGPGHDEEIPDGAGARGRAERSAAVVIAFLLTLFALLSWGAARTKSPTYDEPQNAVGAWMIAHGGDWRVHPDHPALWQYWMALPNGAGALRPDRSSPDWDRMLFFHWSRVRWTADMLFGTPGVDAERVVGRSRAMMLILAVLLGGLLAFWAWQMAGPFASLVAMSFFSLDPNLLAHASLVKNDVALAFATLLLMFALWRLGRKATPAGAMLAALAFAAGPGVKFSGLVFLPLTTLAFLARALIPTPWAWRGRALDGRGAKLLLAGAFILSFVATAWGGIWASYRFRFAPTADPAVRLDTESLLSRMRPDAGEIDSDGGGERPADRAAALAWRPGPFLRAVLWCEHHRILPQAWLYGLVYSEGGLLHRESFLMGERQRIGWWYYMPLAALFKTPLATIAAVIAAAAAGVLILVRALRSRPPTEATWSTAWSAACLLLPIAVFGAALMASRASLGLRHALPIFPFVLLCLGVVAARIHGARRRATRAVFAVLIVGAATETLASWPDYIAYFNAASRPWRLSLLGDSNLDWGQDLKLLADWRRSHPDPPLYLAYFGQAEPSYYGIDCKRFPATAPGEPGTVVPPPGEHVVLAVSATYLQGIYARDQRLAAFYADLRRRRPLAILGGSIYVFDSGRPAHGD